MNNNQIFEIINIGKNLLIRCQSNLDNKEIYTNILILLNIENILDKGRTTAIDHDSKLLSEINKGIDEIRNGIFNIMKNLDKSELKSVLFSASEQFKTNFISNL